MLDTSPEKANPMSPPRQRRKPVQADRVGKKGVIVWLDEGEKRALKVAAAEHDTTMQDLLTRAVREFLAKNPRRKT